MSTLAEWPTLNLPWILFIPRDSIKNKDAIHRSVNTGKHCAHCAYIFILITYRLTTDFFRLFSKARRTEGSSRFRRYLFGLG